MTVDIEPAFWQNRTYQILSVAGVLLLALGFYRRRLRQVTAEAHLRYAERLAERTRIARELHDTLLQSFQGVLLKFSGVTFLIRDRPDAAEQILESAIEQARAANRRGPGWNMSKSRHAAPGTHCCPHSAAMRVMIQP